MSDLERWTLYTTKKVGIIKFCLPYSLMADQPLTLLSQARYNWITI